MGTYTPKRRVFPITSFNSLGSEFSSQGHFHTLQLLNIPQFLFCQVVRLKTAPRLRGITDTWLWPHSPISKRLVKSLEKCHPAVAEKRALNSGNGGPTRWDRWFLTPFMPKRIEMALPVLTKLLPKTSSDAAMLFAKKDRNGPPSANQVASKDEPRHSSCSTRWNSPFIWEHVDFHILSLWTAILLNPQWLIKFNTLEFYFLVIYLGTPTIAIPWSSI